MISTREDGWKEVKPARLFRSSDCMNPNSASSYLSESQHVACLGNSKEFCQKLEGVPDSYGQLRQRLIFLTDGATWIKNRIEDTYSNAYTILDRFHVCEHLHDFTENAFKDRGAGEKRFNEQKALLYESEVGKVIENIKHAKAKEKDKDSIINSYQNSISRMDCKKYRSTGCGIIGSGSVESTHRTVIQKRMKLSGQHWSIASSHNMIRLRILSMNNQWHKVIDIIKMHNINAA
jgi:hypothetical protein